MTEFKFTLIAALAAASTALAAPTKFDFKDPKGVNNVVFKTDAPLESINGTAGGISGAVLYDPANPGATTGKIVVAANSLHVGNPTMKEHLHGEMWMNVAKYPEITFELGTLKNAKTTGDVTTADAAGKLTIKDVTKDITVPVKLTYLKDKLKARTGKEGDLLVVRANFVVKRSDYGINASKGEDKVSDEIDLSLSVAGTAPKQN
ncbi:MAG TPA: YceI family protein [Candidatus Limnocylindria bacterium]|nr:YceI family protein [Candidatus Limnocylindria bacterium]